MKFKKIALATVALATLPLLAPAAAHADSPKNRVLELRDACDKASWDVEFPGLCSESAGSVTLSEFREELADGGDGAWWIRQRAITLDAGDSIASKNVGGIVHTFTEVDKFGKGCLPEWNQAVKETVDNCAGDAFFTRFLPTLVQPGASSAAEKPSVGVHKFQCLIHPWMRTTVTVEKS